MASEFDTGLPGLRKIQSYIQEKTQVELKLVTNDVLAGRLVWQDLQYLCLIDESQQQTLISRSALVYLKSIA